MIRRALDILYLLALALYVLAGTPLVPFHGDEATQIFMSRDYAYQFLQQNLDLVRFQDAPPSPDLQYLRLINGSIAKYAMGFGWHRAGYTVDQVNQQWDWLADWNYNVSTGHAPSEGMLLASRWPQAVFLVLAAWAVFALGWAGGQITGTPRLAAYLASAYFALNPVVLLNGRRAMMEATLLLFGVGVVLAGIAFLRRPSWPKALLLGAAGGLALAAKHTNLFTVAAVFGAVALYPFAAALPPRQANRRHTPTGLTPLPAAPAFHLNPLYLIAAAGAAALVFFALNPVWWGSNPLEHTLLILRLRGDLLGGQTAAFGGYDERIDQFAGFARQGFVVLPQYYEVAAWGEWIGGQIAAYEASPWRGISLGGSVVGAVALGALTLVGLWALLRTRGHRPARWLLGVWALVLLGSTWLLTPIEWARYYLPIYPVVGVLAALGLGWLWARPAQRSQNANGGV